MRRMAQLLASRVSALSAAAVRPSVTALGHSLAPAPVLAQRASLRTLAPFLNGPARPHAPGLSQIRAMTEEASPVLADVLREEVKYEQENYKQPEARSLPLLQCWHAALTSKCACSTFRCSSHLCDRASAGPSASNLCYTVCARLCFGSFWASCHNFTCLPP